MRASPHHQAAFIGMEKILAGDNSGWDAVVESARRSILCGVIRPSVLNATSFSYLSIHHYVSSIPTMLSFFFPSLLFSFSLLRLLIQCHAFPCSFSLSFLSNFSRANRVFRTMLTNTPPDSYPRIRLPIKGVRGHSAVSSCFFFFSLHCSCFVKCCVVGNSINIQVHVDLSTMSTVCSTKVSLSFSNEVNEVKKEKKG
jgi:hypothetical protein